MISTPTVSWFRFAPRCDRILLFVGVEIISNFSKYWCSSTLSVGSGMTIEPNLNSSCTSHGFVIKIQLLNQFSVAEWTLTFSITPNIRRIYWARIVKRTCLNGRIEIRCFSTVKFVCVWKRWILAREWRYLECKCPSLGTWKMMSWCDNEDACNSVDWEFNIFSYFVSVRRACIWEF